MRIILLICLLFSIIPVSFGQYITSSSVELESYIDKEDPYLPPLDLMLDQDISDASICKGQNNTYYLTGTTGDKTGVQDGIQVWASKDLKNWNIIGTDGYVWRFDRDAVDWQKEISTHKGWMHRGIVAPEIHYIKDNYWITYTNSNSNQSGILKSISGRASGPYNEVDFEGPLVLGKDASLIEKLNGDVYFLWDGYKIRKLNDDFSGFNSETFFLRDENGETLNLEQTRIEKDNNLYILSGTQRVPIYSTTNKNDNSFRYDAVIATSKNLLGPYSLESKSIPHAGGSNLFMDFNEEWWQIITGNDVGSPVFGVPALIPVVKNLNDEFSLKTEPIQAIENSEVVFVSTHGNNSSGNNWVNAYTSIQRAIDNATDGSQIWIAEGKYDGPIDLHLRNNISIYGGFVGTEDGFESRKPEENRVIIRGRNYVKHVFSISSSKYIRVDGVTIQGGNASGGSFHHQYGGGMHILGGGETVRIVNCHFENNKADQDGGALYVSVGAAPTLINCIFRNNIAKNNGGAATIYCNGLNGFHTRFFNCVFDNNFAYGDGGAIYFDTNQKKFGQLTLINSLITNNTTLSDGGAICLDRNSNLLMMNSTVCFNKGTTQGAVLSSFGKVPAKTRVVNSIFYQNFGGMLFSIEGEAEVSNVKGVVKYPNIWVQFDHCLFEDNEVNALVQRNFDRKKWRTVYELNESIMGVKCTQGTPAFVDPVNGDFKPNGGSKAKGAGTNNRFFKYTFEGERRSKSSVNIGCY